MGSRRSGAVYAAPEPSHASMIYFRPTGPVAPTQACPSQLGKGPLTWDYTPKVKIEKIAKGAVDLHWGSRGRGYKSRRPDATQRMLVAGLINELQAAHLSKDEAYRPLVAVAADDLDDAPDTAPS